MPILAAPAGQSSVVAGSYRATWNGLDLGLVTTDGYQLRYRNSSIPITADIAGESEIDAIYTGTQPTVTMTLENWNAAAIEAMTWWMGTQAGFANYIWGVTNGVGLKEFDAAKPLVLVACHNNMGVAAASNPTIDPLAITFFRTILAPDQDLEILLSHRPRFITVTLKVFAVNIEGSENPVVSRVSNCGNIAYWVALRNEGSHLGAVIDPDIGGT